MTIPSMSVTKLTNVDTELAQRIWDDFASKNDLTSRLGQTAGIDSVSGRIWFGQSASDIVEQMDGANQFVPLYFIRVGQDNYLRKGGRR